MIDLYKNIYTRIHPELSWRLDAVRVVAAAAVMFGHLRSNFFVAYGDLNNTSQNIANYFLFFITRLGHEAVIVFFVLSGFLVGGNAFVELKSGTFYFRKYFFDRLTRLYIVLIPVLFIGFFIDSLSVNMAGYIDENTHFGWEVFLGNVLFLQKIAVPTYGRNVPLWSLSYEFWYYILWGILISILSSSKLNRYMKSIAMSILLLLASVLIPKIMLLFPIWLIGVCIRLFPSVFKLSFFGIIFLCIFLICIGISNIILKGEHIYIGDWIVGLSFAILIWHWMYIPSGKEHIVKLLSKQFAAFSFSLYVFHKPFLLFLIEISKKLGLDIRLINANLKNWLIFFLFVSIIYLAAYIFYQATEKHTDKIRKLLLVKRV